MTRRPARLVATAGSILLTLNAAALGDSPVTTPSTTAAVPLAAQLTDGTTEADLRVTIRLEEMRRQRDGYEAEQLVAKAVREEMRGRDLAAQELYALAVELDPTNERAQEGLAASRDRLGLLVEPTPLLDRAAGDAGQAAGS